MGTCATWHVKVAVVHVHLFNMHRGAACCSATSRMPPPASVQGPHCCNTPTAIYSATLLLAMPARRASRMQHMAQPLTEVLMAPKELPTTMISYALLLGCCLVLLQRLLQLLSSSDMVAKWWCCCCTTGRQAAVTLAATALSDMPASTVPAVAVDARFAWQVRSVAGSPGCSLLLPLNLLTARQPSCCL